MKKWMILCLAALLAGCSSESKAAEQTASSGSQGCDIFEQCGTEASPSAEGTSFKEAYEALNGTERGEHTVRSVEIPENNPFQEITGDEAAALLDQDGEFYLYIGDEYEDLLADGTWQNFFTEKPPVFTREEKKAWIAKNTDVALGSDAFFPFGDNIERAFKSGVRYVAEPGGSVRDDNVIEAADNHNMVMSFTGLRLFHH